MNTANRTQLIDAIVKEIEQRKEYLHTKEIETIYFGGGTPSILHSEELKQILDKLRTVYNWKADAEITIECNPDDLNKTKLNELKQLGFNRLSIGLQSFNDEELKWMNRAHKAADSINCVKLAKEAGFGNITIDLIYGSKFQDMQTWYQTLQTAIDLNVQHISAYNLTIEHKTKLGVHHARGTEPAINDDLSAEQFKYMINKLEANGFIQYEISNFGKENFFSKHNSNYWLGSTYLGLGPSAHSFDGVSRQWNIASNTAYINKIEKGEVHFEIEVLQSSEKYNEYILTRLRTIWGCDMQEIEKLFGKEILQSFNKTVQKHLPFFVIENNVVKLNLEGKLMADYLASEFFI